MNKPVNYTIVKEPSYISLECPHCHNHVDMDIGEVNFNTDCWVDGGFLLCPICEEEIELGEYDYA